MIAFEPVPGAEAVKLPARADKGSAGYDFYLVDDVTLQPGEVKLVFTNVCAKMPEDVVLLVFIRSSLAAKRKITLANSVGVIDSSYYNNPQNHGNIGLLLYNFGTAVQKLDAGERVAQGIFVPYLVTTDDQILSSERLGGFGASGLK